jgi:hypothetical protein
MINKFMNSSVLDFLIREREGNSLSKLGDPKGKAARVLYSLFKSGEAGSEPLTFRRTMSVRTDELIDLERLGLAEWRGDMIKITASGRRLLEAVILNDDDCVFAVRNTTKTGVRRS